MDKHIAYCGLYCKDCIRYDSNIIKLAQELSNELEKQKFDQYAKAKETLDLAYRDYPILKKLLDKIAGAGCEKTCREEGGCSAFPCEIYKCCIQKGYYGCWECVNSDDCRKFDFLEPFHGQNPKKNIRLIREHGVESLHKKRCSFYDWEDSEE